MTQTPRTAHPNVEPLFLERWSPRAFDGSAVSDEVLAVLFDAARWAPSSLNVQPWRFLYARRDSADWARFLGLLMPMNRTWAQNASVLVIIVSDSLLRFPGSDQDVPAHTHSFDAGAAWALMALQATRLGLHTHGMAGMDYDAARRELAVPDRFRVEAAVAIGRIADKATLPEELQGREGPSGRNPVDQFAFAGNFPQ